MKEVKISTEFIKLDQLLKYAGICQTGGEAKWMIEEGIVSINGKSVLQRGKKCYPGDRIKVEKEPPFEGTVV